MLPSQSPDTFHRFGSSNTHSEMVEGLRRDTARFGLSQIETAFRRHHQLLALR